MNQELALWDPADPGINIQAVSTEPWPGAIRGIGNPTLTYFAPSEKRSLGTALIVCPGGGYDIVSCANEGVPVGNWLAGLGVHAFVLKYRLPNTSGVDYRHPVPLSDAQRALRRIRQDASTYRIVPDQIGIMGFSAGGHLAALASTRFEAPVESDPLSCRPDFSMLIYPVITMVDDSICHRGSRSNLLGAMDNGENRPAVSPELLVTDRTPPTFLVHSRNDKTVPYQNSVLYHEALQRHGVSSELHLYEHGSHGYGLGEPQHQDAAQWPDVAARWMRGRGLIP